MSKKIVMTPIDIVNVGVGFKPIPYNVQTAIDYSYTYISQVLQEATDEQLAAEIFRRTGLGKELE